MSRNIPFVVNERYHIYQRGNDKRTIFLDDHDYKRFQVLLYLCNSTKSVNIRDLFEQGKSFTDLFSIDREETLVDIGSYCLMPNHFHLYILEKTEKGISRFLNKIGTAYSMYFNKKQDRTGSLHEGPFKAKHIDDDAYENWLFSYIHLNPVKLIEPRWKEQGISNPKQAKKFMESYQYSSYHDYFTGKRLESNILNKKVFPDHFSQLNDFNEILEEWSVQRADF